MNLIEKSVKSPVVETPTLVLTAVVYGLWLALTYFHDFLPLWALAPLGAWTVAWQMSLQHEIIHGHLTRSRAVNTAIGTWPLALWLPYEIYRRTHLMHHKDSRLTDPLDDPESYYWTEAQWRALGPIGRAIARAQSTFLGRVTIGPAWSIFRFWQGMIRQVTSGDYRLLGVFARHLWEMTIVLVWVVVVCHMPLWIYVAFFAYAGTGLAMVRSYAEHRAVEKEEHRTAIVENSPLFGLLFLYNNLHVVHHLRPALPWYRIPAFYKVNREALVERNGGLVYDGYFGVIRKYLLKPHDRLTHPFSGERAA